MEAERGREEGGGRCGNRRQVPDGGAPMSRGGLGWREEPGSLHTSFHHGTTINRC